MKKETKTIAEYKAPKCKEVSVIVATHLLQSSVTFGNSSSDSLSDDDSESSYFGD